MFFLAEHILKAHILFLNELQQARVTWPESYGKVFLNGNNLIYFFTIVLALPNFECYIPYVNNHDTATALVETMFNKSRRFVRFLEKRYNKVCTTLSSLLISPVQRIPRYEVCVWHFCIFNIAQIAFAQGSVKKHTLHSYWLWQFDHGIGQSETNGHVN